jgi:hypothetical protein
METDPREAERSSINIDNDLTVELKSAEDVVVLRNQPQNIWVELIFQVCIPFGTEPAIDRG